MFKIRIDPNDVKFSKMIRERDGGKCVFGCGKSAAAGYKMECSHFWGRGNKVTRFDPENCDTLCFQCHAQNEGNKQGFYRTWKMKQLGLKAYKALEERARKMGHYGEYEKKIIKQILTEQEKSGIHLAPGWPGITYKCSGNHCTL